jgi:hypothetical protein
MLNFIAASSSALRIVLPKQSLHSVSNPSVVTVGKRVYAVYKGVNYNLQNNGHSKMKYGGFLVPFSDSQNYYANIDATNGLILKDFGFLEDRHIRANQLALNGLQDIRIFHWRNEIYALAAAITHYPPKQAHSSPIKQTSMMLCKFSGNSLVALFNFPSKHQHEKNWMPWVKENELFFIYHHDPYQILKFDGKEIINIDLPEAPKALTLQSGGSAVVPFGKNFIGIVHQKYGGYVLDDGVHAPLMTYTHKVVIYGQNFDILAVSPNFTFEGARVEFCCGIAILNDSVILSYGVWDNQAVITRMNIKEFLRLLSLDKWMPEWNV